MKQTNITIPGFSDDLTPDDKPAICVFGGEGVGKTQLGATMPGPIGLLALDKKSKRTFQAVASALGTKVLVNKSDYLTGHQAVKVALLDSTVDADLKQIKTVYSDLYKRVVEDAMRLAEHKDVESICLDTGTQLFDWIMFSHFGRRNQIKPTSRGAANQDMIDFINAVKAKNLLIIHRQKETWKSTGQKDNQGNDIQAPTGKFEQEGFNRIGYFVTANIELYTKPKALTAADKFRCRVIKCQTNSLLEGLDLDEYGVSGEGINWENLVTALGMPSD